MPGERSTGPDDEITPDAPETNAERHGGSNASTESEGFTRRCIIVNHTPTRGRRRNPRACTECLVVTRSVSCCSLEEASMSDGPKGSNVLVMNGHSPV
jgi:hypothetical protein